MNVYTYLVQVRKGQSTISILASSWNSGIKLTLLFLLLLEILVVEGFMIVYYWVSPTLFSTLWVHSSLFYMSGQSYDSKFLKIYPELQPTPLQLEEDLEQLKVLENGYKMKVLKFDHSFFHWLACSFSYSAFFDVFFFFFFWCWESFWKWKQN